MVSDPVPIEKRFFRPALAVDDETSNRLSDILPDGAEIGYIVVDLERGTPIAQHRADRDQIPASSAKLATAVAALQLLGPDHRFLTELQATGHIEDGVLKGDLILKGGGDPVLDIPDLLSLIDDLARLSIRRIDGDFLIDDTLLPRFTEIEATQPTEASYNPGVSALSVAFNRVNLRWKKKNKKALAVETMPRLAEASFEGAARDRLPPGGIQLKQFEDGKATWQLADRGARRSTRSLPVKDAGLHAGRVFADLASLYGIDLPTPKRVTESISGSLLAVHESRPLRELVRDMLWYSNNLVAELIGLSAAKTLQPELASLDNSADIVLSELKRQFSDVSWDNARLRNHSGLSSETRLTPEQLAAILRYGWRDGMLSSLLPGSGWSGTLARRFNGPDQALRIWAKTGSINYVTTLGGYLLSPSHGPAAFVMMISDEKARAAYDAQPRRSRDSEKRAQAWKEKADKAMNLIINDWLEPAPRLDTRSLHAQSHNDG
ncbi:MAG: D-alanyl-D-alanine carboxypeptidase/D-alanyl-D-alanine endopeptidase [Geminicoccales bacterium]